MSRLSRTLRILRERGWSYPWQVAVAVALPAMTHRPLRRPWSRVRSVLERPPSPAGPDPQGPLLAGTAVADLDGDGFALGDVPGVPAVPASEFLPRRRFDLEIRSNAGRYFIRKHYRGDTPSWKRELAALQRLAQHDVPAPRPLGADRGATCTDKSFIAGPTLRDLMVSKGARILSRETESDPALAGLAPGARLETVWRRGQDVLGQLDPNLTAALAALLDQIHRAGVTGVALTFGNVVIDESSGQPVFIDFDKAVVHTSTTGLRFAARRDADRRLFNAIYAASLLTEETAAELTREVARTNYSPIDLGAGLVTRGFWSIDSGTGRWEYLNRRVLEPLLPGARILDLGSHNGLMPLLMLRAGARSVVAVERDSEVVEHAHQLHSLFEWREMRTLDLEIRNQDMVTAVEEAEGPFDLVTAFCSLYYLEPGEMAAVVRRATTLAPVMVLQAKTDTRAEAGHDKAAKSSLEFLHRLLEQNGFGRVVGHQPRGFSRPLLVGYRS